MNFIVQSTENRKQAREKKRAHTDLEYEDIIEIRKLHFCGLNYTTIAKLYSVTSKSISRIVRKEIWS